MKIRTAEELSEALTIERANIGTYRSQLGFGSAEIDECEQDDDNLRVTINNFGVATVDKLSVTQAKNDYFDSDSKSPIQPYPSFVMTALPFPSVNAGARGRYINRKERAKLAPGYTKQIGIAMGYESETPGSISPESVKPIIEAFAAAIGFMFSLVVMGRGDAAMWEVQIQRKGSDT